MPPKRRLDTLLVERGLVASRERARAMILAGQVLVGGQPRPKAGALVADDVEVTLVTKDHPYVSRGGLKLAHAIETFGIAVEGRVALDIGASTGGFTDVLLRRGATHVVALDVGHGQLDWRLRTDPRVTVLERVNARALSPDTFASLPVARATATGAHAAADAAPEPNAGAPPSSSQPSAILFEIVTIDVSFISLKLILPVVPPLLAASGDIVALVKPQFEAGRHEVGKGGIVRDAAVHQRVLDEVIADAARAGLHAQGTTPSPIEGMEGNREFLLHLRRERDRTRESHAPPAPPTPQPQPPDGPDESVT